MPDSRTADEPEGYVVPTGVRVNVVHYYPLETNDSSIGEIEAYDHEAHVTVRLTYELRASADPHQPVTGERDVEMSRGNRRISPNAIPPRNNLFSNDADPDETREYARRLVEDISTLRGPLDTEGLEVFEQLAKDWNLL